MSASKSRLYHRLQLAAHRVQKSADRALLAAAEITTAQAAVLTLVARGAITQREVATQLGRSLGPVLVHAQAGNRWAFIAWRRPDLLLASEPGHAWRLYRIDGDSLTVCWTTGRARPTAMDAPVGSDRVLTIYKRVKKKD